MVVAGSVCLQRSRLSQTESTICALNTDAAQVGGVPHHALKGIFGLFGQPSEPPLAHKGDKLETTSEFIQQTDSCHASHHASHAPPPSAGQTAKEAKPRSRTLAPEDHIVPARPLSRSVHLARHRRSPPGGCRPRCAFRSPHSNYQRAPPKGSRNRTDRGSDVAPARSITPRRVFRQP